MARTIAKDHNKKREQILKTAARIFAESGFDRASISQLAKECQISKANIYHYYSSKDALLFDLLDTYLCDLRDRLALVDAGDLTPEEHLFALIKEVLMAYHGADDEHRVQVAGTSALPADQQQILRDYQREIVTQMSDVLIKISPERFATDEVDLLETTMSIFGMLNWYYMWNRNEGEKARVAYAKRVSDLVLNGINS